MTSVPRLQIRTPIDSGRSPPDLPLSSRRSRGPATSEDDGGGCNREMELSHLIQGSCQRIEGGSSCVLVTSLVLVSRGCSLGSESPPMPYSARSRLPRHLKSQLSERNSASSTPLPLANQSLYPAARFR